MYKIFVGFNFNKNILFPFSKNSKKLPRILFQNNLYNLDNQNSILKWESLPLLLLHQICPIKILEEFIQSHKEKKNILLKKNRNCFKQKQKKSCSDFN